MSAAGIIGALKERVRNELIESSLYFEETDPKSTLEPFRLQNHGGAPFLNVRFHHDQAKYFPFFDVRLAGLARCCDYAVFREMRGVIQVLLIELKSSSPGGSLGQLQSAALLCDYLVRAVHHHANKRTVPNIEFRGLVIHKRMPMMGALRGTRDDSQKRPRSAALAFRNEPLLDGTLPVAIIPRPASAWHLDKFWEPL